MDEQNNFEKQPNSQQSKTNIILVVITVLLIAIIAALVIVIVSKDSARNPSETESGTEMESESGTGSVGTDEPVEYSKYYDVEADANFKDYASADLTEYVELGKYMGIEVELVSTDVTEKDITDSINSALHSLGHYTENEVSDAIALGDVVSLDYVGSIDGVEFEGGTGSNTALTIGSGQFIPGFEDGLIGSKVGDVVTVTATFPENYGNEELNGKDAQFKCTINKVTRISYSELTTEILSEIGDYNSIEEYKSTLAAELKVNKEELAVNQKKSDVWNIALSNAKMIKYPKTLLESYMQEMIDYYGQYASYYGYTLSAYVEMVGESLDNFYTQCAMYATTATKEAMVMRAIAAAENITVTDEKYQEEAKKYCELYSMESVAKLEETYGKDVIEETVLWDMVVDYIVEASVEK
ncbi:MAG: trigger factor [Ruminococcaceae bacterium]|nr:trigger factor [Oscillospiraceae bacterium]